MAEITLRPATESDIDAIAEIQSAAYWSNFNELEPGSHDHPGYHAKVIAGALADAKADWNATTIAALNGKPVGVCVLEFDPALLSGLWILPQMQRKGIGTLLIEDAFKRIIARGEKQIIIEVHPRNPAVRLYERSGFKLSEVTTRRSNGLGRDLPLWVMTRTI